MPMASARVLGRSCVGKGHLLFDCRLLSPIAHNIRTLSFARLPRGIGPQTVFRARESSSHLAVRKHVFRVLIAHESEKGRLGVPHGAALVFAHTQIRTSSPQHIAGITTDHILQSAPAFVTRVLVFPKLPLPQSLGRVPAMALRRRFSDPWNVTFHPALVGITSYAVMRIGLPHTDVIRVVRGGFLFFSFSLKAGLEILKFLDTVHFVEVCKLVIEPLMLVVRPYHPPSVPPRLATAFDLRNPPLRTSPRWWCCFGPLPGCAIMFTGPGLRRGKLHFTRQPFSLFCEPHSSDSLSLRSLVAPETADLHRETLRLLVALPGRRRLLFAVILVPPTLPVRISLCNPRGVVAPEALAVRLTSRAAGRWSIWAVEVGAILAAIGEIDHGRVAAAGRTPLHIDRLVSFRVAPPAARLLRVGLREGTHLSKRGNALERFVGCSCVRSLCFPRNLTGGHQCISC